MTLFAKRLIFLNLLLSLLFLGWSIAIYTQRVEWAPARTLSGELIEGRPGKLAKLKEAIEGLVERRDPAEKRWQLAAVDLDKVEKYRRDYQDFYANLLQATENGKDVAGQELKPPFRELIHDDKTGAISMNDVKPMLYVVEVKPDKQEELQYIDFYNRELTEIVTTIATQQKELEKLIDEHKKLTDIVVGIPDKTRGLLGQRDDQLAYLRNCLDEQRYLKPLVNNSNVEIVLLQRRNEALKARLKQLQDYVANR
jgi:hypothetical protein